MWSAGHNKKGVEEYHPLKLYTMTTILKNRLYYGEIVYQDAEQRKVPKALRESTVFAGKHEPLISKELWSECQMVLEKQHRGGKGAHPQSRKYIFGAGLLKCTHCGSRMQSRTVTSRGQLHTYYGCASYWSNRECQASMLWVNEVLLLEQMQELIYQLRLPDRWEKQIRSRLPSVKDVDKNRDRRKQLEERRRRIKVLYLNGAMGDSEWLAEDQKLTRQLDDLPVVTVTQQQILDAGKMIISLRSAWDKASVEEKSTLIRFIVSEITIDPIAKILVALRPTTPFQMLFEAAGLRQEGEWFLMPERKVLGSVRVADWKYRYMATSAHCTKEEAKAEAIRLRANGQPARYLFASKDGVRLPNGRYVRNTWTVWKQLDDHHQ